MWKRTEPCPLPHLTAQEPLSLVTAQGAGRHSCHSTVASWALWYLQFPGGLGAGWRCFTYRCVHPPPSAQKGWGGQNERSTCAQSTCPGVTEKALQPAGHSSQDPRSCPRTAAVPRDCVGPFAFLSLFSLFQFCDSTPRYCQPQFYLESKMNKGPQGHL